MNEQKLQALAEELAKDIKTPEDLSQLSAFLTKLTVEAALKGEMNHHLGYDKSDTEGHHSGNSRNGYSSKTLKGDHGRLSINLCNCSLSLRCPKAKQYLLMLAEHAGLN